jgi:hypothetical protein
MSNSAGVSHSANCRPAIGSEALRLYQDAMTLDSDRAALAQDVLLVHLHRFARCDDQRDQRYRHRSLEDAGQIDWFEEPVPVGSYHALHQVREKVSAHISVGERLHTRWEILPILENHLADYLMPDVTWTAGPVRCLRGGVGYCIERKRHVGGTSVMCCGTWGAYTASNEAAWGLTYVFRFE